MTKTRRTHTKNEHIRYKVGTRPVKKQNKMVWPISQDAAKSASYKSTQYEHVDTKQEGDRESSGSMVLEIH